MAEKHNHALSSDLAKLCLPEAARDSNRKYAWANSICFLFLAIGVVGLRAPRVIEKPLGEIVDIVPVVYLPPEEPPQVEPERPSDPPEPTTDTIVDIPKVATVVAADPAAAAFAVPVEGPVILVPVKFASAPPPPPPPKPAAARVTKFTGTDGGTYPEPYYPRLALEQRQQGTVTLTMTVDPKGNVISVEIKKSSGSLTLDRHAAQWVQKNYKFLPVATTEGRLVEHDVVFQLQ